METKEEFDKRIEIGYIPVFTLIVKEEGIIKGVSSAKTLSVFEHYWQPRTSDMPEGTTYESHLKIDEYLKKEYLLSLDLI